MTAKTPKEKPVKDEEYLDFVADAFCAEAKKENDKFAIAALGVGATIWGLSGNMIAGLAVGGCILLYSDRSVRASNRALELIGKHHVAAPFLPDDKFRDFERKYGKELCLEQLKQAHEYGVPMQGASESYLFKNCPELEQAPQPLKSAAVSSPALTPAFNPQKLPETKDDLLKRLGQECPELLLLVKAPPIRLVGIQRTGKSTFARKLALLRAALVPGHRISWATPHHEQDNPVPAALNPFGTKADGSKNMPAIETAWRGVQRAIDQGQSLNLTAVWDEFGSYDQFADLDCLGKSLKSLLREASKHEYYPILIAHGDQTAFYPGVNGILGTLKQSTVKVETIGEKADEFGAMRPTGEVEVTWLDSSQVRFKVPDWLTVELLISLQPQPENEAAPESESTLSDQAPEPLAAPSVSPNLFQPIPQPAISQNLLEPIPQAPASQNLVQPAPQPEDPWRTTAADLVAKLKELNQNPEIQPKLSALKEPITGLYADKRDDLLWIAFLSAEKGETTAAMVRERFKRKPWFKELPDPVNDAVRAKFEELADRGVGDCFGEGDRRTFLLFENDDRTLTQDAWDTQDAQDSDLEMEKIALGQPS